MRRLYKFLLLPTGEKVFFIKAVLLTMIVKFGLLIFPLNIIRQFTDYILQLLPKHQIKRLSTEKISWAVSTAGGYLLGAKNCLSQALVAQILLKQNGYPANLNFGASKDNEIKLEAHAWVESEGKIIVGEATIKDYTPLLTIKEKNLSRSTVS